MKKKPKDKIEFDLTKKGADKININLTEFKKMSFPKQVKYFQDYAAGLREWIDVTYKVGDNGNTDKVNIEREIKKVDVIVNVLQSLNVKK